SPYHGLPTTPFSPLSLHDALPISILDQHPDRGQPQQDPPREGPECNQDVVADDRRGDNGEILLWRFGVAHTARLMLRSLLGPARSEEHTSELQSRSDLVCRLLLEK